MSKFFVTNKAKNVKNNFEERYFKIDILYLLFVFIVVVLLSSKGLNTSLWLDEAWRINLSRQHGAFFPVYLCHTMVSCVFMRFL